MIGRVISQLMSSLHWLTRLYNTLEFAGHTHTYIHTAAHSVTMCVVSQHITDSHCQQPAERVQHTAVQSMALRAVNGSQHDKRCIHNEQNHMYL